MRKIFLTLVLVTSAACRGGGSNGSGVKGDSIFPEPSGSLKVESDSGGSDVFSNNCQVDKLDPKIVPGTSQRVSFNLFAQDTGLVNLSGTYTVKSVDQSKQTFVTAMSYGSSNEDQICRLTSEGTLCEGSSPTPSRTDMGGEQSCEVRNGGSPNFENSHGTLTLKADGKTISIKEAKLSSIGNLFCNNKDTGMTATQKTTFIVSPDVPALTSARGFDCKGLVFMYQQITDSKGVVRSTSKMEIVSQSSP